MEILWSLRMEKTQSWMSLQLTGRYGLSCFWSQGLWGGSQLVSRLPRNIPLVERCVRHSTLRVSSPCRKLLVR